ARLFLAPLLAGLGGRPADHALGWTTLPLAQDLTAGGDRTSFVRARRCDQGVRPLANQDSSGQGVLAGADLLIRQRPGMPARPARSLVDVLTF
ncbi:MAG TPA: molybdopterin molybdenumtransferase MoeA, partial [Caulobacter sp.]|nr:molybdopterin molybdenumtransferase MoeA [Caulobacter sp.]